MERISAEMIAQANATPLDQRGKVLIVQWALPGHLPRSSNYRCWCVRTWYIGSCEVEYLDHIDTTVPGGDWCGQTGAYGTRTPTLGVDAAPVDVARAAIAAHGNDYYSRTAAVWRVLVEHPTIAGVVTMIDPEAIPAEVRPPKLADSCRRYSVI